MEYTDYANLMTRMLPAGMKCVVLIDNPEPAFAHFYGYDTEEQALQSILTHVSVVCERGGTTFRVVDVPHMGQG